MATKKKKAADPPARGGASNAPSEEYFTETLGVKRLHVRLPIEDYKHLVILAGGERRLRAFLSELIQEKWATRKA